MNKYLALFLSVLFSSAALAETVTIEHQKGTTEIEMQPKRVVAIGFGVLDALDKFGIDPVAVANASHLPSYLAKYNQKDYLSAGSHFEPDFENIFTAKPDLIIIGPRASSKYEELAEIAPTIVFSANLKSDYWTSTQQQWRNLGKIFAIEDKVEQKIKQLDDQITAIRNHNQDNKIDALTVLSLGENITTFGAHSRFSAIYQDFGFLETVTKEDAGNHGDLVSYEFIHQVNPSIILAIDRNKLDANSNYDLTQAFDNDLIKQTKAYKNQRIAFLDVDSWYVSIAGVHSTEQMIKDVQSVTQL
ncbi:siderophore ABC transporter substrate-binding protein [Vibrio sp. LaRot3]|uniref:siderophore ABC transporter substrate-binding protein n=1 Tax=Vibrio sp. LaRot3 TaxID=2998829 RepID=UPI0022CDD7F5|nr:siderophore ABC transporter substrate-binding protein [Vibrio sp. LaRot3]MDA0146992.1 siderophore ABC transporter substrate-binding protein [Vibrio sp. LaRot3]